MTTDLLTTKRELQEQLASIQKRIKDIDFQNRSALGQNLILLRGEQHLTQEVLAKQIGVTRVVIANIETGHQNITVKNLMKMCDVLGVTPNDLLLKRKENCV